jgi:superfamily I DNA and RNA helicase
LTAKSLIERKEIGTRSGRVVLVELTKKGSNLLEKLGYDTKNGIRQYGLLHEFWRDKVRRYYEKMGYKVTSEEMLNGERVDLVAEKDKDRIAIEIETGNSNAIEIIKKCPNGQFNIVVSVPIDRWIENQLKERLRKEKLDEKGIVLVINSDKFE